MPKPMGYEDEEESGLFEDESDDFEVFGAEALGISLDDPEAPTRLAALKEAVMACMETDYSKPKSKGKASKDKDEGGLALIFGGR